MEVKQTQGTVVVLYHRCRTAFASEVREKQVREKSTFQAPIVPAKQPSSYPCHPSPRGSCISQRGMCDRIKIVEYYHYIIQTIGE